MPPEITDEVLWRQAYARRLDSLAESHDELREQLDVNTAATQRIENSTGELVKLLESWKGAIRVLETIGKVAKPLSAIVSLGVAVWVFLHPGAPK